MTGEQYRFLSEAKSQGMNPIEAIKGLRAGYGLNLKEAKIAFMGHPEWNQQARDMDALHEELIQILEHDSEEGDGVDCP